MNIAIVFAGGIGVRMGSETPKQFLELQGKPVLAHTLLLFERHPRIDKILLVAAANCQEACRELAERFGVTKLCRIVAGGASAQESIYSGLKAAAELFPPETVVLIHDGVRPYLASVVIDRNIDAVEQFGNAVTYTPCYETIVLSKDGKRIDELPLRRESYTAQAPQSFRLGDILSAHERIRAEGRGYEDLVDQATICWSLGLPIHLVEGCRGNIKITTYEDILMLDALLGEKLAD